MRVVLYSCHYTLTDTMSALHRLWFEIQDIIGPASQWPRHIRRNFWATHLTHWERICMAAFMWINGLNPEVFNDWCDLRQRFVRGSLQHRHFTQLFQYFELGRHYSLWSWNVTNGRFEWLDGSSRLSYR